MIKDFINEDLATKKDIAELEVRITNGLMIFFGAFFFGTVGVTFTFFRLFLG